MEHSPRHSPRSSLSTVAKTTLLAGALMGCHPEVKPLPDTTVEFAVLKLLKDCAEVRETAKAQMGDPNKEITSADKNPVHESCVCAGASCDYTRIQKAGNYSDVTGGSFMHFDRGDPGVLTEVEFFHEAVPSSETQRPPKVTIAVTSTIAGRSILRGGKCDFSSSYQDTTMMNEPRIRPSAEMTDCLTIDAVVGGAIDRHLPQRENRTTLFE